MYTKLEHFESQLKLMAAINSDLLVTSLFPVPAADIFRKMRQCLVNPCHKHHHEGMLSAVYLSERCLNLSICLTITFMRVSPATKAVRSPTA